MSMEITRPLVGDTHPGFGGITWVTHHWPNHMGVAYLS